MAEIKKLEEIPSEQKKPAYATVLKKELRDQMKKHNQAKTAHDKVMSELVALKKKQFKRMNSVIV